MSGLSHGLNISKKGFSAPRKPPPPKKALLGDDEEDEDEDRAAGNGAEEVSSFDDLKKPKSAVKGVEVRLGTAQKPPGKPQLNFGSNDLSAKLSASKHAAKAQDLDSNVYDYDAVYDRLHAKPAKKKQGAGPQYMQKLLESAEVRKRDQLRAKEKMLAKEREAEGEEFADKDKFVTTAYKAQQEELSRLEAEERKHEEEAEVRRKREGGGMRGLYKGMLEEEDARHQALSKSLESGAVQEEAPETDKEKELAELAKEKGAVINEEGQVVDKRQLLSAGLNVAKKPVKAHEQSNGPSFSRSVSMNILSGHPSARAGVRERQSRLVEQQFEQVAKRAAEEEATEEEALKRAAKSRKTDGDVSSAKERYLQRKREAEAAKAGVKNP